MAATLEERMARVEQQVAELTRQSQSKQPPKDWRSTIGMFDNDPHDHKFRNQIGHLKDCPLYDEWQQAMQDYRDQVDREERIESTRDHSAFLNGYAPEDEGLYEDVLPSEN